MPNTHSSQEKPTNRSRVQKQGMMPDSTDDEMKLNVEELIKKFRKREHNFSDFEHSESEEIRWIRNSHAQGLVKAQQILEELKTIKMDKSDFTTLLGRFLSAIPYYFDWREVMHWRDASASDSFQYECTEFLRALPIKEADKYNHYSSYFSERMNGGFAAVNYFILFCHFVWDPQMYCVMKVSRLEKVFKLMGTEIKLSGHLMDYNEFNQVNTLCQKLYKDLAGLIPESMSDVQIFMHIVTEKG